MKTLKK